MTCKHNWHFRAEYSNEEYYAEGNNITGFHLMTREPKEGLKNFAEFICDKCMKIKIKELKEEKSK